MGLRVLPRCQYPAISCPVYQQIQYPLMFEGVCSYTKADLKL